MLALALLLAILALPVLAGLNAFFGLQHFESRIGITSYVEMMRLRASSVGICGTDDSDVRSSDDTTPCLLDFETREQAPDLASTGRPSTATLAK